MNANQPEPKSKEISVREDFWESVQCPVCRMYFGVYTQIPVDEPSMGPRLAVIPPDKVKEAHEQLIETWRQNGTLGREHGQPVVNPKTTN